MKKRFLLASIVLILSLVFTTGALAKPKTPVLIEKLTYLPFELQPTEKGFVGPVTGWLGQTSGVGTINCNGVQACIDGDFHDKQMNFNQVFVFGFNPDSGPTADKLKASTKGQFVAAVGTIFNNFKGRGTGDGVCAKDTCGGSFTIKANINGGGKIVFDLNFVLDDTHGSETVTALGGTAIFKGAELTGVE